MSDETTDIEPIEAEVEETAEVTEADPVALAKREAANAKREATRMRKQLEELQAAEDERRQAEMTELERERERAEGLLQQLEQMRVEQETAQKRGWLGDAARTAKIDSDVAAALIKAEEIESADDARVAIEALASEKPHLVMQEQGRVGTVPGEAPKVAEDPEAGMANFLLSLMGRK
jgi:hypothetical protein